MENFNVFIFCLLLISTSYSKENIAVMELYGNNISEGDLGGLSERLRTELFNTGKFNVVERSRMNEILKEQGFQQTGCTNTECAVEIGQLIGVKQIVVGSISKVGTIYSASIRMVDVVSGKIDKTATEDCEDCSINNVLKTTIHNVARVLAGLEADKVVEKKPIQTQPVQKTVQIPVAKPEIQPTSEIREWEKLGMSREVWVRFKQSGITIEEWNNRPKRSVGGAVALSIVLPGGGHYYYRNTIIGLTYTAIPAGLIICGTIALSWDYSEGEMSNKLNNGEITQIEYDDWVTDKEEEMSKKAKTGISLIIIASSIHLIDIIHAGAYASRYNKGILKYPPKNYPFKKVSISPSYDPINKRTRLSLTYNF